MDIRLTKLSDHRHRFEAARADGSVEAAELETRSLLVHDLTHYAVEAQARLDGGFYGLLARGVALERLADAGWAGAPASLQRVEALVGPMQAVVGGSLGAERYVELAGDEAITPAFVAGVVERMRRLQGEWRALPYGQTMTLAWPPADWER